jgi:PAS domain S-box-containing protein
LATSADPTAALFRMLVESVEDYAIFILDATGHVQTWNTGAERIKGYRADEIIGRHFSTFYPEEDLRAGKCEMELEVAGREGRFEDEGWRLRKDGSRFWANVVITAMRDPTGALVGFSKVTRDLTLRRQAEEERAARLAAEQANQAKDEFLAMLGHELRNPLAPIVTALQLMRLRGDVGSAKEQQVIERQVNHVMRLVDDLLDVSRIARGKVELRLRLLDLRDVVARAIELASPLIEQRQHRLVVDLSPGAVTVDGDEARLVQVFGNLLTNAARYTPAGGEITVMMRAVGGSAVVAVRDDGMGIDAATLPRIFDLFVQGERGAERGGLGLGLTLARSLVALHRGTVEAVSAGRGQGSTFTVRLPIAAAASAGVPSSQRRAVRTPRPRRILLVDDNDDARGLLADALVTIGHQVRSAADGPQALAALDGFVPDVAILDIGLPVMDGYELAGRLRAQLGTASPRLVALTGYGQPGDRARTRQAGFDMHLVKPVDLQELIDGIATLTA